MEQKNNEQTRYKKNPNEVGVVFSKINDKGIEYLAIKLNLNGKDIYLKGFLNSGWDDTENSHRPKFLVFPSNNSSKKPNYNRQDKLD